MHFRSVFFVLLLSFSIEAMAGDGDFAVSKIPAELLTSANAVKRMEEVRFEILELGKAREYQKFAITVMNENGDRYAVFTQYYDQLVSIESVDGTLYDATGKKIRSLKKSEILDRSASDNNNLADDNRVKYHSFYQRTYPYTVVYEVELKYNCTMFFPTWDPVDDEKFTVQESKFSVVCPDNYKVRYKAFNYDQPPAMASEKGRKTLTWEVKNLPAIRDEYASPPWRQIAPVVYLGPDEFEIQGYRGNMQSWQDFGKFTYFLKKDRDQLPADIKSKVHQIADPLSDKKQKISQLYQFMQDNTRYVSIQLGIGGWQPFDATDVAQKKYGDCKALSNYMYSLLKEAGIRSLYTLIIAGRFGRPLVDDFPSQQFNHVILCVPLEHDTVWLECTSQTLPAGYLSGFTQNRLALLVDESGGTLVRTPRYGPNENLQTRKITAAINEEGTLTCSSTSRYSGMQQDDLEDLVSLHARDKLSDILKTSIDIPTYDIVSFDYELQKSNLPVILESVQLSAPNYAQLTGKRMFINPNILNKSRSRLETEADRKYPIKLTIEFRDIDSATIAVPPGFTPESSPADVEIKTTFGAYTRKISFSGDKITYYRKNERYAGDFPATAYVNLVDFYEKIFKADHTNIVLIKK